MKQDGMLYDAETETRSARLAGTAMIDTKKTVKNARKELVGDTTTGIVKVKEIGIALLIVS